MQVNWLITSQESIRTVCSTPHQDKNHTHTHREWALTLHGGHLGLVHAGCGAVRLHGSVGPDAVSHIKRATQGFAASARRHLPVSLQHAITNNSGALLKQRQMFEVKSFSFVYCQVWMFLSKQTHFSTKTAILHLEFSRYIASWIDPRLLRYVVLKCSQSQRQSYNII